MKISVIATTGNGDKNFADNLGSKAAAVCYMRENFDVIQNESADKTARRVTLTKASGHHSVYDHFAITLLLEDIPKLLAMLLNNENDYTTSEKSARYTKMATSGREKELYEKWLGIFKDKIVKAYANEPYVMKAAEKLAGENARYIMSVLTPATTIVHTISYRQFNVLYAFAKKMQGGTHPLAVAIAPALKEFCAELEKTGFVDEKLVEKAMERGGFSLFFGGNSGESGDFQGKSGGQNEVFGDVYLVKYRASFAILAHLHRHRTIYYSMSLPDEAEFYIPPIIRDDAGLVEQWQSDMQSVASTFPNGMMVDVVERGTIEKFIMKAKLRHCARAQLEICNLTMDTMRRFYEKGDERISEMVRPYLGMRCTFKDFKCGEPCAFADGIRGTRRI